MSLAHMQRAGHRPIALVWRGNDAGGRPSGKTEMRRLMSRKKSIRTPKDQETAVAGSLTSVAGKALMANNADWLCDLNYIEFLRDIGRHFSVNRMLAAESYKVRLESGLSFIEFNYMLLQPTTTGTCSSTTSAACKWEATTSGGTFWPGRT